MNRQATRQSVLAIRLQALLLQGTVGLPKPLQIPGESC